MTKVTTADLVALDTRQVTPDEFCDALFDYLTIHGRSTYDETVTQLEHGLQCAALAKSAGYDEGTQVAALLHDIGHLALDEHDANEDFLREDQRHEMVGARLITRWFGPDVGAPVALHVAAKRYLVAIDPSYQASLSSASIRSLEVQGGAMDTDEVRRFEALPHHALAVELRRWDDHAKVRGAHVDDLERWRGPIQRLLAQADAPHSQHQ